MKKNGRSLLIVFLLALLILGSMTVCALAEEKGTNGGDGLAATQSGTQLENDQSAVTTPSAETPTVVPSPSADADANKAPAEESAGDGSAAASDAAGLSSESSANIVYSTHVQNDGWQASVSNGALSGTTGRSYRLEGIRIAVDGADMGVKYRTHVQDFGWQPYVENNETSGTVGQSKRLEAIQIELTGNAANQYDVYYRVHAQDYGWLDWAKDGQMAGTEGLGKRLEAIQIQLVSKGGAAPGSMTRPYVNQNNAFSVKYQTHVQDVGWQGFVGDGNISGTQGQSKRLEAIRISLSSDIDGGIRYKTHIQNIGWESDWTYDGNLSGTQGQSKRLEAIQIELTGNAANQYDVYYRVHAQNFGWMGWAKNGASAGTEAYAYRLEAIQIQLVAKGGAAPGSTDNAFRKDISRPAKNAYRSIVAEHANRSYWNKYMRSYMSYMCYYSLFDMDSDGIPELIMSFGTCEADNKYYIYTYSNGEVRYLSSFSERTMAFYGGSNSSNGVLYAVMGHMDHEYVFQLSLTNGVFNKETIVNNRYTQNYYSTPYPVTTKSGKDLSLFN